jgi:DNA-binding protein YbaB
MTDPLVNVRRLVDEWERDAVEKAARYENMRRAVEGVSITASAASGAVSVTVGHNGIPTDVTMTEAVSRLRPEQIASAVLEAMRQAQARYPAELARIMRDTVGDTATTRHILTEAERVFPRVDLDGGSKPPSPSRWGGEDDGDLGEDSVLR